MLHSLPVLGSAENVSAELKFNQLRGIMKVFQHIWQKSNKKNDS